MAWKIFYSDGTTFDSSQGEPHEAPIKHFICALGYDPVDGKRYQMHGWDFYRWDRDNKQWWGFDRQGRDTRLEDGDEIYAYKVGFTVTKAKFLSIMDTSHRDPDFPMVVQ